MRFYQVLIHLYPSSFRAAYGEEMQEIFENRRREASGIVAITTFWFGICLEVVVNAAAAH